MIPLLSLVQLGRTATEAGVPWVSGGFFLLILFLMYAFTVLLTSILDFSNEIGAWFSSEWSKITRSMSAHMHPKALHH
jgi:uncharacterized protein HemY